MRKLYTYPRTEVQCIALTGRLLTGSTMPTTDGAPQTDARVQGHRPF